MALRHFPYQHPTFGTAKNPKTESHWKVSVYYWWFEYLRRNEEYRKTSASNGLGKCSKVFAHFGDVSTLTFKEWWSQGERGARLFAEPPAPSIRVISLNEINRGELHQENVLVLQIPLGLPISFLVRSFRRTLSKYHEGKRGKRQSLSSKAMFQATGKVDVRFLEIALMVWDAKTADPSKPLWRIANDLGIAKAHNISKGDSPAVVSDKKNILAATASRYYRRASQMINRAGTGRFPN
jgi:hypothetical protein